MKIEQLKIPIICIILILAVVVLVKKSGKVNDGLLCPSQYQTSEAAMAAFKTFSDNFYQSHPNASIGDMFQARHDFYISHNCTKELAAYQQAADGKADPKTMKIIDNAIQETVHAP
jgi:hypothetical protein